MKLGKIVKYLLILTMALFTIRAFWSMATYKIGGDEADYTEAEVTEQTTAADSSLGRLPAVPVRMNLPADFEQNVLEHIKRLSSFGIRTAGSKPEDETTAYIRSCLEQYEVQTEVEKFSFEYYDSDNVSVKVNGTSVDPLLVCIDPYNYASLNGKGMFLDPKLPIALNLTDEIVITGGSADIYELLKSGPRALIFMDEAELDALGALRELSVQIDVSGENTTMNSYNIVGTISPPRSTDKEIIISAHWDSTGGPGASDNASGVGILLELSRYYQARKASLPCTIRFAALGAEELGFLGARAYTSAHEGELKNCKLDLNVDEIGGNRDLYIGVTGGGTPDISTLQPAVDILQAMSDYKGNWLLNRSMPQSSKGPDWLRDHIVKTCEQLGCTFRPGDNMDSDDIIFAQRGVPSVNIYVSGDVMNHSPEDTPDRINPGSLLLSGEIAVSLINKVLTGIM